MKKISTEIKVILLAGALLVLLAVVFQIPALEGFNPSDDGVILAQSFRILQGQLPHADFISIRPAGSPLFHLLAFALPGPLEMNARWIVYLQYLIYSSIWALLLFKRLPGSQATPAILVLFLIMTFVLNQNHYNLYPWTTIDALFFFSLAFLFYSQRRYWPALLLASFSALCRQTFILPLIVLIVSVVWRMLRQGKRIQLMFTLVAGALPFLVYGIMLLTQDAVPAFIDQMTGRTELWETGFLKFWHVFWRSPMGLLWVAVLVIIVYQKMQSDQLDPLLSERGRSWISRLGLVLTALVVVLVFVDPSRLFVYSFLFFFGLLLLLISRGTLVELNTDTLGLISWILLISWTSAISLGDNAPVFATGLLAAGLLLILLSGGNIRIKAWPVYGVSILLSVLFIFGQRQTNYRDLPSAELTYPAGEVFRELGKIKTNRHTYEYLAEVRRLYELLDQPQGRFAVVPNGALLYPLLNSPNPMPLDWMQGAEMVKQESAVMERLQTAEPAAPVYILMERYNSKLFGDTLQPLQFSPEEYPWIGGLMNLTESLDSIDSEWFMLRVWK